MGKKGQQKQRQYLGVTTRESENILDNSIILLWNLLIEITVLGHIKECSCSYKVYIYVFQGEIQLLINISTTYKQFSKI